MIESEIVAIFYPFNRLGLISYLDDKRFYKNSTKSF